MENNCLRDDKNAAFDISSPSLAVVNKHLLHHAIPCISRKPSLIG